VLPGWISKRTIFFQRLLLGNMRNLLFVFSFLQYYRWFYRSKANESKTC
jgi:nicotinamide riboside transporter PnuC